MSNNRNMSSNRFVDHTVVVQGSNYAPINAGFRQEDRAWLKKISQENPAYHKTRIFEAKGALFYESFRWILGHSDFKKWRDNEKSGVFWVKGDPGKGKTMLLGGIVDDFEQNPRRNINLTYFFCQATDSRINTATAVIGGLIVSFIKQRQELRSIMYNKYADELGKLNGPDRWYILCDIFEKVTQHPDLMYPVCVVDALDECEQDNGCKQLLKLIVKTSCRVKWLISSRNITEIERGLQAINSNRRLNLELKENAKYITKSVNLYINDSVQTIIALQGDKELQIKVANTLRSKANGTFLWVALVIEQLRETKHRNVKNVLEEMPEGLENLYNLILQRLTKQEDKDAYQVLLSIVTAAKRPLRLEELYTFVRSQWGTKQTINDPRDIRDLVKDCGSFLSIQNDTVYFIHQSVKEYMMGTASRTIFPSGIEYQHYRMFTTSLSAMSCTLKHNIYSLEDPGSDIDAIFPPSSDPLAPIEYCCVFWVEHLFQSCESGVSRDKLYLKDGKTLHSFLKAKYLCWLESLALLRNLIPQGTDAIQKLGILLSGYQKSKASGRHAVKIANSRRKGQGRRYRFMNRYKDLYFGTYIKYACTFFHYYDDSHLRAFINDACQFFHYCKDYVRKYPLQLYHSAIIFEDTRSEISTTIRRTVQDEFKNTPTFLKKPQRQISLVQHIELNCRGSIIALLYSPDSSFLGSLSQGGTISLCETDTGSLRQVIELDVDKRYYNRFLQNRQHHLLAFSMNSKHLVAISSTGIVQVWAFYCGTRTQKFSLNLDTSLVPRPKASPSEAKAIFKEEVIALSYYGDLTASTCRTLSGTVSSVKVWALQAGGCTCLQVLDQSRVPDVLDAAFSPNLAMLVLLNKKDARVYSVQTGKVIKVIRNPESFSRHWHENIMSPRFSQTSGLLVLQYNYTDKYLWCTETWTKVHHVRSHFSAGYYDLSPNAAMSVLDHRDAFTVESIETGEPLLSTKSYVLINRPIFSPDWANSSLLASFSNSAVQIWRAGLDTSGKSLEIQNTVSHISSLTISPKSKFLAACHKTGNIEIWCAESGERIRILEGKESFWPFPVFSPNLDLVICAQGHEGDVQIWHVETGRPLHLLKGPGARCRIALTALSDDSRHVVAGYSNGQIKVWSVESGKCVYKDDSCGDDAKISKVAFSAGSQYIAWAFNPRLGATIPVTVCIWDWRKGHCIFQTKLDGETWYFTSFAFSSDATVLVIITESKSSSRSFKAEFYDITSSASLGHIDIGKSNRPPLFDPSKDHIVSDYSIFCKRSSWSNWHTIRQSRYCYTKTDRETWVCFGEHKMFQIPRHVLDTHIYISDHLLAFTNIAGEIFIIKLPIQSST